MHSASSQISLEYQKICNPNRRSLVDAKKDFLAKMARLTALEQITKVCAGLLIAYSVSPYTNAI